MARRAASGGRVFRLGKKVNHNGHNGHNEKKRLEDFTDLTQWVIRRRYVIYCFYVVFVVPVVV
jgi:hypothetical protein